MAELIAPQLRAVDELFASELLSDLPNVNELVTHVAKFRGKMLRPMLVLLSGMAAGHADTQNSERRTQNFLLPSSCSTATSLSAASA